MTAQTQGYEERTLRTVDGLTLSYREYGSRFSTAAPALCLAGLTRNARDFHELAVKLSAERRVLALDARGRGRSDNDPNHRNYNLITEVGDVLSLVSKEFDRPCAVIGTSRGGLAALILNAVRPAMVGGVALNDIGPELQPAGLQRIMAYLGRTPEPFETWEHAVAALQASNARDFPELSEAEWMAWARRTFRDENGRPAMDYDPRLRDAVLEADGGPVDFWPQFRAIGDKPLLVLRGEHSDLLAAETVSAMRRVKPDMTAVTVRGRGHAPFLTEPEALSALEQFIRRVDARLRADAS